MILVIILKMILIIIMQRQIDEVRRGGLSQLAALKLLLV